MFLFCFTPGSVSGCKYKDFIDAFIAAGFTIGHDLEVMHILDQLTCEELRNLMFVMKPDESKDGENEQKVRQVMNRLNAASLQRGRFQFEDFLNFYDVLSGFHKLIIEGRNSPFKLKKVLDKKGKFGHQKLHDIDLTNIKNLEFSVKNFDEFRAALLSTDPVNSNVHINIINVVENILDADDESDSSESSEEDVSEKLCHLKTLSLSTTSAYMEKLLDFFYVCHSMHGQLPQITLYVTGKDKGISVTLTDESPLAKYVTVYAHGDFCQENCSRGIYHDDVKAAYTIPYALEIAKMRGKKYPEFSIVQSLSEYQPSTLKSVCKLLSLVVDQWYHNFSTHIITEIAAIRPSWREEVVKNAQKDITNETYAYGRIEALHKAHLEKYLSTLTVAQKELYQKFKASYRAPSGLSVILSLCEELDLLRLVTYQPRSQLEKALHHNFSWLPNPKGTLALEFRRLLARMPVADQEQAYEVLKSLVGKIKEEFEESVSLHGLWMPEVDKFRGALSDLPQSKRFIVLSHLNALVTDQVSLAIFKGLIELYGLYPCEEFEAIDALISYLCPLNSLDNEFGEDRINLIYQFKNFTLGEVKAAIAKAKESSDKQETDNDRAELVKRLLVETSV